MKGLLILLMVVPLAGCFTSHDRTQPMALAPDDADKPQCIRYGFPPDTPAFGDCNVTAEKP